MPRPIVRFRVDFTGDLAVGPGKIALLERIRAAGSLSAAARELGMSYRRAWQLLESLNGTFREPVVSTSTGGRGGGGARLTAFGEQLVRVYREFERDLQSLAIRHFETVATRVRSARPAAPRIARVRLSGRRRVLARTD